MQPVKRFHWDTPEYAAVFATLLRCIGGRIYLQQILREIFSRYPAESHAIDWGAGEGDLTRLLLERFQRVYAVEPHPGMRTVLTTRCPNAQVFAGTLISTIPATHGRSWSHQSCLLPRARS
jgi:hypothetical protein